MVLKKITVRNRRPHIICHGGNDNVRTYNPDVLDNVIDSLIKLLVFEWIPRVNFEFHI